MNLQQLQPRHAHWQSHNFTETKASDCLHGIVEECGELATAYYQELRLEEVDAIADIAIYTVGFCTLSGILVEVCELNFEACQLDEVERYDDKLFKYPFLQLLSIIGDISHNHLKLNQGIRGSADELQVKLVISIARLIRWLKGYCLNRSIDFEDALETTWAQVEKRDWVKWKRNGIDA